MQSVFKRVSYLILVLLFGCGSNVHVGLGQVSHAQENDTVDAPVRFQPIVFDIPPQAANPTFIQDRDGFFWIGTQFGLVKWDGMHATLYTKANSGISDPIVTKILEGQDGLLWFGTFSGGLNKYDKETNTFTQYHHDPGNPQSISSDAIGTLLYGQSIIEDNEGFLWIGTTAGLNRFDPTSEQFTRYQHDPTDDNSLSHNEVLAVYEDSAGVLWIGTDNGLNRFDKSSQILSHYFHDPHEVNSLSHDQVHAIVEDHEGVLWVGTDAGLDRLNRADDTFTRYRHEPDNANSLANPTISYIMESKAGDLWMAHYPDGKVTRFNKARDHFVRYQNDPQDPTSLPQDDIKTIYQDRSGVMWFVDVTGGVAKYDPQPPKFRLYERNPDNPDMLNSTAHGVVKDNEGLVWFTTDTGFSKYDPQTNVFSAIDVSDTVPYVMLIDSADQMWVGEKTGNLSLFDRQTESYVQTYPLGAYITGIREDNHNPDILWITSHDAGLIKFNKQTEDLTYYQHDDNDSHSISLNSVWSIYQEDNLLWLGTLGGGLNKFDKTMETFSSFLHDESQPETISHNIVAGIVRTSAGELWLGTRGGLNKLDEQSGTFEHYNQVEGTFPTDVLVSILEDKTGHLWVEAVVEGQTSYIKFDPESKKYRVYGADDGVQTGTAWAVGYHQTQDGEIWYTGSEGVNAFYPEQIKENDFIPPVYLTALRQGGEELGVDKAYEKLAEITLDWQNNFFEFEYVALNYTHPENNQYAYMLEGVDKDWYSAGTRRFGRYTGLDPGAYTLRIKGSNNDGVWNEQGVSIRVIVIPPWWQTWWFRGGLGLLLVGLVLGGVIWRVRSVENRRRQLEQQVAEKTAELQQSNEALTQAKKEAETAREKAVIANQAKSQFLSNMSHELRTPLNGILGYAQILKRGQELTTVQADGLNIIQQSGNHLLTLINDILDLAKIEAGKLDLYPTNFHLPSFLQGVAGIIRMRADQKDLLFSYESLSPLPSGIQADEKRLRQILLNLLGNAVKFTDTGYVTLNVTALSAPPGPTASVPLEQIEAGQTICLRFQVLDTGVGMTAEQLEKIFLPFEQVGDIQRRAEGTGLGLSISRQLVQAMGSRLQVTSTPGEGSTFWFDLTCLTVDVEIDVIIGPEKKIIGYHGDRRKILIADDKDYNRLVLVNLLEPLGFQTVTANDGREAVERASQFEPDLILTDVVMPVMTGIEAVLEIRQIPALQDVPIIAVSASVLKEDRHQTKLAGCNDFLGKPVNAERLFAMLANYMTLEWIYETPSAAPKQPDSDTLDLIPPPPEQLAALLNLSRRGNMQEIAQQAAQIAQMGEQYRPFAHLLEQLAKGYHVKKVQNLIKHYAGEE